MNVLDRGESMRIALAGPAADLQFPICRERAEAGDTDYFIQPLRFSHGQSSYVSWSTAVPGGFSETQLAILRGIERALAIRVELVSAYLVTENLLRVYLGFGAARRVLAGQFTRGGGQRIQAVIWLSDLRGFTSWVDHTPLAEVLPDLDRYFATVAKPIGRHGGEVLKFIGDAVLAIFPICGDESVACAGALAAAREALQADKSGRRFGVALHRGEVMYGNIGAPGRLDFTVMGPAVNEVSRVEALCKPLACPLLITRRVAELSGDRGLVSLGEHPLRGVSVNRELFTLPELALSARSRGE